MENIGIVEHRNLDEEYPRCGKVDCVFIDCPLSKGPCLFCTEEPF